MTLQEAQLSPVGQKVRTRLGFSFIVTTYQCGDRIKTTLRSFVTEVQELMALNECELIVIDDRSSDDTLNEVMSLLTDSFVAIDWRVISCIANNGGPARSRNLGIELSKNELLVFFDWDDLLNTRDYLRYLSFHRNDLYAAKVTCFNRCPSPVYVKLFNLLTHGQVRRVTLNGLMIFYPVTFSGSVISSDVCNLIAFNESVEYHGAEDFDFFMRILTDDVCQYISWISNPVITYVVEEGSLSAMPYKIRVKQIFHIISTRCEHNRALAIYAKAFYLFRGLLKVLFRVT